MFNMVKVHLHNDGEKNIGLCGGIVKGKKFNDVPLFKVISENIGMGGFKYQIGLNVDNQPFDKHGSCERGLYFTTAKHIPSYLHYGNKLCVIKVPDKERVYVDKNEFRTHSLELVKIYDLNSEEAWELLINSGLNITKSIGATEYLVAHNLNGIIKKVNYALSDCLDQLIRAACWHGNLEILKYAYMECGASLSSPYKNISENKKAKNRSDMLFLERMYSSYLCYASYAIQNNHEDIVDYLAKHAEK